MGTLLDRLDARPDCFELEQTGFGVILIRRIDHEDDFTGLVRHLLDTEINEYVVLPVTDGYQGYERVILLSIDQDVFAADYECRWAVHRTAK